MNSDVKTMFRRQTSRDKEIEKKYSPNKASWIVDRSECLLQSQGFNGQCILSWNLIMLEIEIAWNGHLQKKCRVDTVTHVMGESHLFEVFMCEPGEFPGQLFTFGFKSVANGELWKQRFIWTTKSPQSKQPSRLWQHTSHITKIWIGANSNSNSNEVDHTYGCTEITKFCAAIGFGKTLPDKEVEVLLVTVINQLTNPKVSPTLLAPRLTSDEEKKLGFQVPVKFDGPTDNWFLRQFVLELYCQLVMHGFNSTTTVYNTTAKVQVQSSRCSDMTLISSTPTESILSQSQIVLDKQSSNSNSTSTDDQSDFTNVPLPLFLSLLLEAPLQDKSSELSGLSSLRGSLSLSQSLSLSPGYFDLPINEYYINSSHNTYLVGNQIGGVSDIWAYARVLLTGCRCVELDIHDANNNKTDSEPVITHGMAKCTVVLFKDVLKVINDFAFAASDLPLVLSFENHCKVDGQKLMASHLLKIFGDKLLTSTIPGYELGKRLPSPNLLKNKIIIKWKNPQEAEEDTDLDLGDSVWGRVFEVASPNSLKNSDERQDKFCTCFFLRTIKATLIHSISEHESVTGHEQDVESRIRLDYEENGQDCEDLIGANSSVSARRIDAMDTRQSRFSSCFAVMVYDEVQCIIRSTPDQLESQMALFNDHNASVRVTMNQAVNQQIRKPTPTTPTQSSSPPVSPTSPSKLKLAPELTSLVNYFTSKKQSMALKSHEMFSIKEGSCKKWFKRDGGVEAINFSVDQNVRVYPDGTRIKSSNYDPQRYWDHGCQMVALNFQSVGGAPLIRNECMFQQTSNCGYVKKPKFLRKTNSTLYPLLHESELESAVSTIKPIHLLIRVLSGRMLPLAKDHKPYSSSVAVSLVTSYPQDAERDTKCFQSPPTKTKDCLAPEYNGCATFMLFAPELAMIKLAILNDDRKDREVARVHLAASSLGSGCCVVALGEGISFGASPSLLLQVDVITETSCRTSYTQASEFQAKASPKVNRQYSSTDFLQNHDALLKLIQSDTIASGQLAALQSQLETSTALMATANSMRASSEKAAPEQARTAHTDATTTTTTKDDDDDDGDSHDDDDNVDAFTFRRDRGARKRIKRKPTAGSEAVVGSAAITPSWDVVFNGRRNGQAQVRQPSRLSSSSVASLDLAETHLLNTSASLRRNGQAHVHRPSRLSSSVYSSHPSSPSRLSSSNVASLDLAISDTSLIDQRKYKTKLLSTRRNGQAHVHRPSRLSSSVYSTSSSVASSPMARFSSSSFASLDLAISDTSLIGRRKSMARKFVFPPITNLDFIEEIHIHSDEDEDCEVPMYPPPQHDEPMYPPPQHDDTDDDADVTTPNHEPDRRMTVDTVVSDTETLVFGKLVRDTNYPLNVFEEDTRLLLGNIRDFLKNKIDAAAMTIKLEGYIELEHFENLEECLEECGWGYFDTSTQVFSEDCVSDRMMNMLQATLTPMLMLAPSRSRSQSI